jgi:hypothetical protein
MPISTKKTDGGRIKGPQNVASVIEIRVQMQLPNTKLSSWFTHGSYSTAPANMQSLATALFGSISAAWNTNLAAYCPTGTLLQNVYIRDMTNFTSPVYVGTGTAVPGTSASIAMPPGAAIVLTENLSIRGRGAKGRIYLGGFATNADAGGGVIAAALVTALGAFCTALFNAITAQSLTPCLAQPPRAQYQGVTGTVHPSRGAGHPSITSYTLRDNLWDAQRRRAQL